MDEFKKSIRLLEEFGQLPKEYKPHKLWGGYEGYWEAHLKPDWLIIWKIYPHETSIANFCHTDELF